MTLALVEMTFDASIRFSCSSHINEMQVLLAHQLDREHRVTLGGMIAVAVVASHRIAYLCTSCQTMTLGELNNDGSETLNAPSSTLLLDLQSLNHR